MENVHIIYGAGYGKTAAAMGLAVKAAGAGQTVTIVQFLKGSDADYSILSQFDEIQFFTFENSEKPYGQLTFEEREEQRAKAKNSFHYAKKTFKFSWIKENPGSPSLPPQEMKQTECASCPGFLKE